MDFKIWHRNLNLLSGQEYLGNKILAEEISSKGYDAIIQEYVYIDTQEVEKTLKLVPGVWDSFRGKGIDLGGGVGCISSTIAKKRDVDKIYCIEIVEDVVKLCHPIVKKTILKNDYSKVISVVGDFDHLELENNSLDFSIAWDSMHHSSDPIKTLKECHRVLKKNSTIVIIDRAHNNSTPDSEIERMLNIVYDEEFLIKNHRPKDLVLTRKENGEHEYRFFEWENFFQEAGFDLLTSAVIKTKTPENLELKNDNNLQEIFTDYKLGAFGDRKVAFVLKPNNN